MLVYEKTLKNSGFMVVDHHTVYMGYLMKNI